MAKKYLPNTTFGAVIKVSAIGPLDNRQVVENKSDLINPETWEGFAYTGMLVAVENQSAEDNVRKLFMLSDITKISNSDYSGWKEISDSEDLEEETDLRIAADQELQQQINNLKARGRFLALWNAKTGLALSNPPESPYSYNTGDYFIVSVIDDSVNYKPSGSTYIIDQPSTTPETEELNIDDVYYYDGAEWKLQKNTQKIITFSNIEGDPYDNENLSQALEDKQNKLNAGTNIQINQETDTISVVDLPEHVFERGTGNYSIQSKNTYCEASGDYSVALGEGTKAMGLYSFSEGNVTKVFNGADAAHAEGIATNAKGAGSHVEGQQSETIGDISHAEGGATTAIGDYSHTEGNNTIANNPYEHAEGHFNKSNQASSTFGDSGNTIHSIGIGNQMTNRKNATEVMQNGDFYVLGIGGYDGKNYEDSDTLQTVLDNIKTEVTSDELTIAKCLNDLNDNKQDNLISGENIKTVNNESLLGEGNIEINPNAIEDVQPEIIEEDVTDTYPEQNDIDEGKLKLWIDGKAEVVKATKQPTLEIDFTNLPEDITTLDSNSLKELINSEGKHLWLGDITLFESTVVPGKGLLLDFENGMIEFMPEIFNEWPNLYINKTIFTFTAATNEETGEYCNVTIENVADDYYDDSGWIRRSIPANGSSFTYEVTRTVNYMHEPEEGGEPYVDTKTIYPYDYITIQQYNPKGEATDFKVFLQSIKFEFVKADTEEDYEYENYTEAYIWKGKEVHEIDIKDWKETPEETEANHIFRAPDQTLNVTDFTDAKPGYNLVENLDDLTDGDYIIASSTANYMMSNRTPAEEEGEEDILSVDKESDCNIDRDNKCLIFDDTFTQEYYEEHEFSITRENDKIHIFCKLTGDYIGYTGAKNGINTDKLDIFNNTVSLVDGNITVTCEGSGASTLKHNTSGHLFRFYKTGQTPIQFYKKFHGSPYSWKQLAKKTDLDKLAFTGDYNDLKNIPTPPVLGDTQIFTFDVLPKASEQYLNIIARSNHKLYDIDLGDGWNFAPIDFTNTYPTISGSSAENQLREWMISGLNLSTGIVKLDFFNESSRISCSNTVGRGLQIGSGSNVGKLKFKLSELVNNLDEETISGPQFLFSKIYLTFEQYGNETSHTIISLGNSYTNETIETQYNEETGEYDEIVTGSEEIFDIVNEEYVDFEYEEESQTIKTQTIEINLDENCNTLVIDTELRDELDRGRVILKELEFEDLTYFRNPDDQKPIIFKSRYKWVPISGESLIAGPGIEISGGKIINTLSGNVLEKQDAKAISEAIYKIKTNIGLDENLNPEYDIDSENITKAVKNLNDANQTIAGGFYKLRTELGLNKYLEMENIEADTMTDAIIDLENANQTIANTFYKVEQKTGLTNSMDLPEDFDYASLVAAINDLKTRIEQLEQK